MAVELHFQVSMFGKTGISQGPLDGIPWNFKQASLDFRAGTNEMLKPFSSTWLTLNGCDKHVTLCYVRVGVDWQKHSGLIRCLILITLYP